MKLYVWQPEGHGQLSFFVMAASEAEALAAVNKVVDAYKVRHKDGYHYEVKGWGTDYYSLSIHDAGEVVQHDND